jgi:hypothetical protein
MKVLLTWASYEDDPEYAYFDSMNAQLFPDKKAAFDNLKKWAEAWKADPEGEDLRVSFSIYRIHEDGTTTFDSSGNLDDRNDPILQT